MAAGNPTVTQNNKTATLADYDNSYDKWLVANWAPKFPAASGCYSDTDGFGNTQKIVAEFIANHSKTAASADYAAGYCYNYTPSNSVPGLEKHTWFLGSVKDVSEIRALSHTLLIPISWFVGALNTCSQYSAVYVWQILAGGRSSDSYKYSDGYAIPLADLILET